jgi:hypothetical protein
MYPGRVRRSKGRRIALDPEQQRSIAKPCCVLYGFCMKQTLLGTATRAELESAVVEHDILPTDAAGCERIVAMSTEELRAAVTAWIEAGDETS